jgi:hypothetical protein
VLGINETTTELRQANPAVLKIAENSVNDNRIKFNNPVADEINVSAEDIAIAELRIFDINGRIVAHRQFDGSAIDVSSLPRGTYVIMFATDRGNIIRKMLKE